MAISEEREPTVTAPRLTRKARRAVLTVKPWGRIRGGQARRQSDR